MDRGTGELARAWFLARKEGVAEATPPHGDPAMPDELCNSVDVELE
jgi:hypothetical protein